MDTKHSVRQVGPATAAGGHCDMQTEVSFSIFSLFLALFINRLPCMAFLKKGILPSLPASLPHLIMPPQPLGTQKPGSKHSSFCPPTPSLACPLQILISCHLLKSIELVFRKKEKVEKWKCPQLQITRPLGPQKEKGVQAASPCPLTHCEPWWAGCSPPSYGVRATRVHKWLWADSQSVTFGNNSLVTCVCIVPQQLWTSSLSFWNGSVVMCMLHVYVTSLVFS